MKKILILIFVVTLILTGCGKNINNEDNTPPNKPEPVEKNEDLNLIETGIDAVSDYDHIYIEWEANIEDDLAGYYVFRRESAIQDSPWIQLTPTYIPETNFTDQSNEIYTPIKQTPFYYKISAIDLDGNESDFSTEVHYTLIEKPTITDFSYHNVDSLKVTWTYQQSGEYFYIVKLIDNTDVIYMIPITDISFEPEQTVYIDLNQVPDFSDLKVRVDVTNNLDKVTFTGSESQLKTLNNEYNPPPQKPVPILKNADFSLIETGIDAVSDGNHIYIEWEANTEDDLAGYYIFRRESAIQDSPWIQLTPTYIPETNFTDQSDEIYNPVKQTPFYYKISAIDLDGNESDFSTEVHYTLIEKPTITDFSYHNADSLKVTWNYQQSGEYFYIIKLIDNTDVIFMVPITDISFEPEQTVYIDLDQVPDFSDLKVRVDVTNNLQQITFTGSESQLKTLNTGKRR